LTDYLFINGLFNDVVSSSDHITSDYRVIHEQLIAKDEKGSGLVLISGIIRNYPEEV
jgi:hypothetical protein